MIYLHSLNNGSIFRTLIKSVAFSVLTATLCNESFGAIQSPQEEEVQIFKTERIKENASEVFNPRTIKDVDFAINMTNHPHPGDYHLESVEEIGYGKRRIKKKILFYDIPQAEEFEEIQINETAFENLIRDIRADEGSYNIKITGYSIGTAYLTFAPTYMRLFYNKGLREYCGCSFCFYSDFFAKKYEGRNITINSDGLSLELVSPFSVFRITDNCLNSTSFDQRDELVRSEIARREGVKEWLEDLDDSRPIRKEIAQLEEKNKKIRKIGKIKRAFDNNEITKAIELIASFSQDSKLRWKKTDIENNQQIVARALKECDKIQQILAEEELQLTSYQKILTEDCLSYLLKQIPLTLEKMLADSESKTDVSGKLKSRLELGRHDTEQLSFVIEAIKHIIKCYNSDSTILSEESLASKAQRAHELAVINRLNRLETERLDESNRELIKRTMQETIEQFSDLDKKKLWGAAIEKLNVTSKELLRNDPELIDELKKKKEELDEIIRQNDYLLKMASDGEIMDNIILHYPKKSDAALQAMKFLIKNLKNKLKLTDDALKGKRNNYNKSLESIKEAIQNIEVFSKSKYPIKPKDLLKDVNFVAARNDDWKGRALANFIQYFEQNPINQNAINIDSWLNEIETVSEKLKRSKEVSKTKTTETQPTTKKAKKKTSEIKEDETVESQSARKKAKKEVTEMKEKEITESREPTSVKPPRTKKQR